MASNSRPLSYEVATDKKKMLRGGVRQDGRTKILSYGKSYSVKLPVVLYSTQLHIIEDFVSSFCTRKNLVLESPTGTGKTICFIIAAEIYIACFEENARFVFTCRTRDQLRQIIGQVRLVTNRKIKYGVIASRDENTCLQTRRTCYGSFQREKLCRNVRSSADVSYNVFFVFIQGFGRV